MSKKNKNRHKKKNIVNDPEVLVAPVVARATDVHSSMESDASEGDVTDAYLKGSLDTEEVGSQGKKIQSTKTEDKPQSQHTHHSHVHQTCQSPQLRKKVKNLTSMLIIASGFAVGTIFIDVAQLFTQRGLSARALGEARIVQYDGATWVKYDEPKVSVDVFRSKHNSAQTQQQIEGLLSALSYSIPTLEARIVDVDSGVGALRAKDLDIAYAPAMHFSADLSESPYYKAASDLFVAKSDGTYLLKMDVMDINIDHFLESPRDDVGVVVGVSEAPHSVVVFENFLCETCINIHEKLTKFQSQNPEKLKIVYKNVPASGDQASTDAANVGHCAYAQGQYEQYAKILFTNSAWKTVDGELREDLFMRYAGYLPTLDIDQMRSCYKSREYEGQLVMDVTEANRLGLGDMLPTIFADGVALTNTDDRDSFAALQDVLDSLLTDGEADDAL